MEHTGLQEEGKEKKRKERNSLTLPLGSYISVVGNEESCGLCRRRRHFVVVVVVVVGVAGCGRQRGRCERGRHGEKGDGNGGEAGGGGVGS